MIRLHAEIASLIGQIEFSRVSRNVRVAESYIDPVIAVHEQ